MAKEIESFTPHLVLGIGGTGSRVLQRLMELTSAQKDRVKALQKNRLLNFVAIDTDVNDLQKLGLPRQNQILISEGVNMPVYAGTRKREDELRPMDERTFRWFPPRDEVGTSFETHNLGNGAGQIRFYSRIGWEYTCQNMNLESQFENLLGSLISIDVNKTVLSESPTIIATIVGSIAGGTGSGIFLQVAAMLKDIAARKLKRQLLVKGYFFTADIYTRGGLLPEEQHDDIKANTYACLKDLNAFNRLLTRINRPILFDETELDFIWNPRDGRRDLSTIMYRPYDMVYIVDATNSTGTLPVGPGIEFRAYESMLADALYCSIFTPISSKALSIENNEIINKIAAEQSGDDFPGYGAVGAARVVFPVDDVSDFLSYKYCQSILSSQWARLDRSHKENLVEFNRAQDQGRYNVKMPERHQDFIRDFESEVARGDEADPSIIAAANHYKYLTGAENAGGIPHGGDLKSVLEQSAFVRALDEEIEHRILGHFHTDSHNVISEKGFSRTMIRDYNTVGILQQDRNHQVEYLLGLLHNNDRHLNAIKQTIRDLEATLARQIVRDCLDDDASARTSERMDQLKDYQLIRWLTLDPTKKGHNIFFIRYFLSRELESLRAALESLKKERHSLERKFQRNARAFDDPATEDVVETPLQLLEQNIAGSGINGVMQKFHDVVTFRNNFVHGMVSGTGEWSQDLDTWMKDRLRLELEAFAVDIKMQVYEALFKRLGFDQLGSQGGLLDVVHKLADTIISISELFERNVENKRQRNLQGGKLAGAVLVHCQPDSKDYIWKSVGGDLRSANSVLVDTYQGLINFCETTWRDIQSISAPSPEVEKQRISAIYQRSFRLNAYDETDPGPVFEKLIQPSRTFLEAALRKKYNVLSAMLEEAEYVRGMSFADTDEKMQYLAEQLGIAFSNGAPFTNVFKDATPINVVAYNHGLIDSGMHEVLEKFGGDRSVSQGGSIDDPNVVIFYRTMVGQKMSEFRNVLEFRRYYVDSVINRHIHREWPDLLPELSDEIELEHFKRFAFCEAAGIIQCANADRGEYQYDLAFRDPSHQEWRPLGSTYRNALVGLRHMIRKHSEFRNAISDQESQERSRYDRRSSFDFADRLFHLMDTFQSRASSIKDGLDDKSITPHILERLAEACSEIVREMVSGTEAEFQEARNGARERKTGNGSQVVGR